MLRRNTRNSKSSARGSLLYVSTMRDSLYHRNKITLCSEGFGSNLRFCNITTAEECAKSDSAWCAAINWWKNPPPSAREKYSKFKFSEAVADFLSGSPAFHCEQIGTHGNGCGIPPSCTGPQLASGAALQPVLLSLSNINSVCSEFHCFDFPITSYSRINNFLAFRELVRGLASG